MLFQKQNLVSSGVVSQVNAIEEARRTRMATAWKRYSGEYPDALKKTKLDPEAKDNVKLNLAKLAVNTSAFFLFGKGVQFEVDKEAKSPYNDWLQLAWEANSQAVTLMDSAINGGVFGDVFLRLKLPDKAAGEEYPRVIVLDPQNVTVVWEGDDCTRIKSCINQWTAVENGKAIVYRQRFEKFGRTWTILEEESAGDSRQWVLTAEFVWAFPFCPIFHCKNLPCPNGFYGAPDLEDDLLNNILDINFLLSSAKRIFRAHGHPKTWGRGFQASDLDLSVDSLTAIQSADGVLQNLEMQSDLTGMMEFTKLLKGAFHEMASVPEIASGKVEDVGQLSALALKILYGPLLRLTETKRPFYGEMLEAVCRGMLEVGGRGRHTVKAQWQNPLPRDEKVEAETATAKQEAGISKDTTLTEMGYDPEAEAEKRQEEAQRDQEFGAGLLAEFERNGITSDPNGNSNGGNGNGQ